MALTITTDFDGGNINPSGSGVVDGGTSTPTVTLVPRTQGITSFAGGSAKYRQFYVRLNDANTRRPTIRVDQTGITSPLGSSFRIWYSYDNRSWTRFDANNTTDGNFKVWQNSTAFNQATVYIAMLPAYSEERCAELVDDLAASEYFFKLASANIDNEIGTTTGQTDDISRSLPDLPMYGVGITDQSAQPDDGRPKRTVIITGGIHPGEQTGAFACEAALRFLISDDAKAVTLRKNFNFLCYPNLNPQGRYGGHFRGQWDDAGALDPNRDWNDDDGFALESSQIAKAAIEQDATGPIAAAFDFHGTTINSGSASAFIYTPGYADSDDPADGYIDALDEYGGYVGVAFATENTVQWWMQTSLGVTHAAYTPESKERFSATVQSQWEDAGDDSMQALADVLSARSQDFTQASAMRHTYQITIDPTAFTGAVTDFPMPVTNTTLGSLAATILTQDGGTGTNIWFSSDQAGNTAIPAKLEYPPTSDKFRFVVKADGDNTDGATFFLHVNDKPGGYSTNAYDDDTELRIPGIANFEDVTTNERDGTAGGSLAAGGTTGPDGSLPATVTDEIDDNIEVTDFTYGDNFRIGAWIKPTDNIGTDFQYLFSHAAFQVDNSINLVINEASQGVAPNVLRANLRDGTNAAFVMDVDLDVFTDLLDGGWHRVDLVCSTAGGAIWYIDGVQRATSATWAGFDTDAPAGNIFWASRSDEAANRWYGGGVADMTIDSTPRSAHWLIAETRLYGPNAAAYLSAVEVSDGAKTWQDIPILYGQATAIAAVRSLLVSASSSTQRIAWFGDSRSTSPTGAGTRFIPLLNYEIIKEFTGGRCSESPVSSVSSFGGGAPAAKWLMSGATAGTSGTSTDTPLNRNAILPGMGRSGSSTGVLTQLTNTNGAAHCLEHDAARVVSDAGIPTDTYIDASQPLIYDFFGVQDTGAPDVRWRYIRNTTPLSYFTTFQEQGLVSGLDGTGGVVKLSTPSVTNADFENSPYSTMVCRIDGSETNAYMVGGRWRLATDAGGISVSTFSLGGYQADRLVDDHSNAGQMLSAMGPWAASGIHLGVNDIYSGSKSAATWKSDVQAMIAQIRSASWLNDSNHLIILTTDSPRINGSTAQDTEHDLLGGAAAEIADADPMVVVVNTMLGCEQRGFTRATGATYLGDDVHPNAAGAEIVAQSFVDGLRQATNFLSAVRAAVRNCVRPAVRGI